MTNSLTIKVISCLLDQLYQIECANEEQVNEDFSVSLMEVLGAELRNLSTTDLSEFLSVTAKLAASGKHDGRKDYFDNFAENFGLDDSLA
jgi:hypothetical protein